MRYSYSVLVSLLVGDESRCIANGFSTRVVAMISAEEGIVLKWTGPGTRDRKGRPLGDGGKLRRT